MILPSPGAWPLCPGVDRWVVKRSGVSALFRSLHATLLSCARSGDTPSLIRSFLILLASAASLGTFDSLHAELAIDPELVLTISGSPGSFHTLLSASKLDGKHGWQVLTNLTLDGTGNSSVQLSPPVDGSRFYKRFAPEGLVAIPPGTFRMGSPESEARRESDETQHTVEEVSWNDATNFCGKLTQRDQAAGLIPADYAYRFRHPDLVREPVGRSGTRMSQSAGRFPALPPPRRKGSQRSAKKLSLNVNRE